MPGLIGLRGQCAEHLPEFVTRFYPLLHAMHIFRDPIPLSLNLVFTSERSTTLHFVCCTAVLEKDPVGSKVLKSYVSVSNSEIKAEKEQPDHEVILKELVPFTQLVKVRRGQLVLALPNIRFS